MTAEVLVNQLMDELSLFGIVCSHEQATTLVGYLDLVLEKNKVLNLTRITEPSEAVTLHLVDSLLPLAVLGEDMSADSSFVDMGTGAGFPGVPLHVLTGAPGVLIDSVGKKVRAVTEFAEQLGLTGLEMLHTRVEDFPKNRLASFNYVFARAVAQTNVLIEYATPLLKMGGSLVVEKGRPDDVELQYAEKASQICGLQLVSRETFELLRDSGHREVLVYKKIKKASIKLPRKAGTAKRNPLGVS